MGCTSCERNADIEQDSMRKPAPAGYIVIWQWDDLGAYRTMGRCYYCNHPRR